MADNDIGELPMHNVVPRLSRTPGVMRRPAPGVGEHTAEVLAEIGLMVGKACDSIGGDHAAAENAASLLSQRKPE